MSTMTSEYFRGRADTSLKPSVSLSSTHLQTSQKMVEDAVDGDLLKNSYVADTGKFLNLILPVEGDTVSELLASLAKDKVYDEGTRQWRDLPVVAGTTEVSFYKPFVAVANTINQACSVLGGREKVRIRTSWIDAHSTPPSSRDDDAPKIRPDILAVLGTKEQHEEWEKGVAVKSEAVSKADGGTQEEVKSKQAKKARADWLRVHVPVEIKSDNKNIVPVVRQLCTYMRQVFREQADRRFVLGLALCKTDLSVWLCDRSGLIGTQTPINIHKEPEKFIQVIAALALLNPEQLGWDTSMKLYRPHFPAPFQLVHSYHESVQFKDFSSTVYETPWAIEMPKRDGSGRETFISVRGLSMTRSEIMHGRATVVWEVVKLADIEGDSDEIQRYVLKQSWRPVSSRHEAEFYGRLQRGDDRIGANVGELYSFEDVEIEGFKDTTSRIRHELPTTPFSIAVHTPILGKRDRDETIEASSHVKSTSGAAIQSADESQADPRVLSRLVMETYGWPIKFFKDIPELLRVIRDALQGHQDLYYKAGVLHRDISIGNILICPEDDVGKKTHGRIIDLDYAKLTDNYIDAVLPVPEQDWDEGMKGSYDETNTMLRKRIGCHIDKVAFSELYNRYYVRDVDEIVKFVKVTHSSKDLPTGTLKSPIILSCDDLDVYHETRAQPDFSEHAPQMAPRTATLPFASYEVLADEHYNASSIEPVSHNSIHDVEALFWVSQNVCLTRGGPGGSRRRELKLENSGGVPKSLERIVFCFFDSTKDVLANNRRILYKRFNDLESIIMPHFHPYFESLKPLMLEWSRLLRLTYKFPSNPSVPTPTLHCQVIAAIEKTLQEIENTAPSTPHPATVAELKRRKRDLAWVQEFRLKMKQSAVTKSAATQYTTVESAEVDLLGLSPDRARSDVREYTAVGPPDSPTQGQPPKKKPTIRK
ncbi:hypothetical protein B0H21DRAFT_894112 [Amylocystis lapponica]|nr:hypothetical protein B0H21DRAFT_894112 [Amylocystis lapponica]